MARKIITMILFVLLAAIVACIISTAPDNDDTRSVVGPSIVPPTDASIVRDLQSHGDPLTKPRLVKFYLYFALRADADSTSKIVAVDGFSMHIIGDGKRCLLVASKVLTPTLANVAPISDRFRDECNHVGGDYDGWHCKVVR